MPSDLRFEVMVIFYCRHFLLQCRQTFVLKWLTWFIFIFFIFLNYSFFLYLNDLSAWASPSPPAQRSFCVSKPVPYSLGTYGTSLGIGGCGWGRGPWGAGWSAGGLDYVKADQPPGSVMERLISLYFYTSRVRNLAMPLDLRFEVMVIFYLMKPSNAVRPSFWSDGNFFYEWSCDTTVELQGNWNASCLAYVETCL
jgi:hypothetical protein